MNIHYKASSVADRGTLTHLQIEFRHKNARPTDVMNSFNFADNFIRLLVFLCILLFTNLHVRLIIFSSQHQLTSLFSDLLLRHTSFICVCLSITWRTSVKSHLTWWCLQAQKRSTSSWWQSHVGSWMTFGSYQRQKTSVRSLKRKSQPRMATSGVFVVKVNVLHYTHIVKLVRLLITFVQSIGTERFSDKQDSMVRCSNQDCHLGCWFHQKCIGMLRRDVPAEDADWWCSQECRESGASILCLCKKQVTPPVAMVACSGCSCNRGTRFHLSCMNLQEIPGAYNPELGRDIE